MSRKGFIISTILILAFMIIGRNIDNFSYSREFLYFLATPFFFCIVGSASSNAKLTREANKKIIFFTLGYASIHCLDYFYSEGIDFTYIISILSGGAFTLLIWNYILKEKPLKITKTVQ